MKPVRRRAVVPAIVVLAGIWAIMATSVPPRPPASDEPVPPLFLSLVAQPAEVCLNRPPITRITHRIDTENWSEDHCVVLRIDGTPVHASLCQNLGLAPFATPPAVLETTHTLNVMQHFNQAPPASFVVRAELIRTPAGTDVDAREITVTTKLTCPPPGLIPG